VSCLIKDLRVTVAPYISRIANMSFTSGIFPKELKFAEVTPIVKKIGLPTDDLLSYRPISNLSSLSKILEKLYLVRVLPHVSESPNFDSRQSAYVTGRSTETCLLKAVDDLHAINDSGSAALLVRLDLSSAFDCIDHKILTERLETDFGITGPALQCIESFLTGRSCSVVIGGSSSRPNVCRYGVIKIYVICIHAMHCPMLFNYGF